MLGCSPHLRIGIDEAGRGAWAGPVVAAAVYLPHPILGVDDSKVLSPRKREYLFSCIIDKAFYGIGEVTAEEIDQIGIKAATNKAMERAIGELLGSLRPTYPTLAMVDGNDRFTFSIPHHSYVRGDSRFPCISAASIVAKVHRDRHMMSLGEMYPAYGFIDHKGYGTPKHATALAQVGICPEHRKTYAPVARILEAA